MPLDHHGKAIVDALPDCIEKEVPYTGEYLDSRFLNTSKLMSVSRTPLMKLKEDSDSKEDNYYIDSIDLQPDQ